LRIWGAGRKAAETLGLADLSPLKGNQAGEAREYIEVQLDQPAALKQGEQAMG
jgi:hypothetical protein